MFEDSIFDDGEQTAELVQQLNRETARIAWRELQKYYARGVVVAVSVELDLIEVAAAFVQDDKTRVQAWLAGGEVYKVEDELAQQWLAADGTLWAVVVAPWVLVQAITDEQRSSTSLSGESH